MATLSEASSAEATRLDLNLRDASLTPNKWLEVGYFTGEGASGSTRLTLGELPAWLAERPHTLIHRIKEI